jgi:hypothetical protein
MQKGKRAKRQWLRGVGRFIHQNRFSGKNNVFRAEARASGSEYVWRRNLYRDGFRLPQPLSKGAGAQSGEQPALNLTGFTRLTTDFTD